jgi:hypothetical protein
MRQARFRNSVARGEGKCVSIIEERIGASSAMGLNLHKINATMNCFDKVTQPGDLVLN